METVFTPQTATLGLLKITVSPDDYQVVVEKEIKKVAHKVQIKGFRPGKTPLSVVKNLYGKQILMEEVNKLFSSAVDTYLNENPMDYLGEPIPISETDINDWNKPADFIIELELGMCSPFELSLDNIEATKYTISLTDKEIEEVIENLLKDFAKAKEVEISEEDDMIFGFSEITLESGEIYKNDTVTIPTHLVKEDAKSKFLGLSKDSKVTFFLDEILEQEGDMHRMLNILDQGQPLDMFRGKEIIFTVERIERKIPSELNQEVFDEIYPNAGITDETTFREKIAKENNHYLQNQADELLKNTLKDKILETHHFELPHEFMKRWLVRINKNTSLEQIEEEYPSFAKGLPWILLQRKLMKAYNIKVSPQEIEEYGYKMIVQQMKKYRIFNDDQANNFSDLTKKMLMEDDGKQYRDIENFLTEEKINEALLENVKIHTENKSWSDFLEIANSYYEAKKQPLLQVED